MAHKKWYVALNRTQSVSNLVHMIPSQRTEWLRKTTKTHLELHGPFTTQGQAKTWVKKYGLLKKIGATYGMKSPQKLKLNPVRQQLKSNPVVNLRVNAANAVEIYGDIHAIEATKSGQSLWPKQAFRHDFTQSGTKIYGLQDGSILIKGNQKLWKNFSYDKSDL